MLQLSKSPDGAKPVFAEFVSKVGCNGHRITAERSCPLIVFNCGEPVESCQPGLSQGSRAFSALLFLLNAALTARKRAINSSECDRRCCGEQRVQPNRKFGRQRNKDFRRP